LNRRSAAATLGDVRTFSYTAGLIGSFIRFPFFSARLGGLLSASRLRSACAKS
jgi:hypothetical protein